ncbi:hypothetical protein DB29_00145 [Shouchella clausii]|nr:hypothetical protein DB29_00145 [Shouchella clausii]
MKLTCWFVFRIAMEVGEVEENECHLVEKRGGQASDRSFMLSANPA